MSKEETRPRARSLSDRPLLATQFIPPQPPSVLVQRERLLVHLDAAFAHRLVLFSASAGSGKTTLLSTWARRAHTAGQQVMWLSLDVLDNDPTHFWISLITALRTCLPTEGSTALQMLRTPQPAAVATVLTTLINETLEQGNETVLILDDYQVIEDEGIHKAMAFLLDHLPPNLHMVLASRTDPDLPLARWRMRGQMLEIRDADLSFRLEETEHFLAQASGYPFPTEDLHLLQKRTEGWVAGLQLAALALRKHEERAAFFQAFTGSHRYLMDYVQQEILSRQPLSLQQFLLQIAILPRMNADLCQAVTGESASQEFLETLERHNLFLVPLDEQRQWYRLHDLFREVLLARLHTTQPEQVPLLHGRAARWFEVWGDVRTAIAQALTARDFSYAASLMVHIGEESWLNGEVETLYRQVIALPDVVMQEHARLALTTALYVLNTASSLVNEEHIRGLQEAERLLARVEHSLRRNVDGTRQAERDEVSNAGMETTLLRRRLHLLRLWQAALEASRKADIAHLRLIEQAMQQLEQDEDILWHMPLLATTLVLHWSFLREGTSLVPLYLAAKQRALQSENRYALLKTMQYLALSYLYAGQLRQAHQEFLATIDLAERFGGHPIQAIYLQWGLAGIEYARNHLEEARLLLDRVFHIATAWHHFDLQLASLLDLLSIELALHRPEAASHALLQAEELAQRTGVAFQSLWLTQSRVCYWLATGDLAQASAWAAHLDFHENEWNPQRWRDVLLLARVHAVQRQYIRALETLERFRTQLDRAENIGFTIAYLALFLVVLHHAGRGMQARSVATRLFALTEPEGYVRVYLDEGEPMRATLKTLYTLSPQEAAFSRSYVATLLTAFEQNEQQCASATGVLPGTTTSASQAALIEPLSSQEQRVLHLLVAGRSNPEIARALVVSVNTVKTHLQSVYRKLGVINRVEASAAARNLDLL